MELDFLYVDIGAGDWQDGQFRLMEPRDSFSFVYYLTHSEGVGYAAILGGN